jgi:hypothetical protein
MPKTTPPKATVPDPVLGIMRDAIDEMNEISAEAMMQREQQSWRQSPDA